MIAQTENKSRYWSNADDPFLPPICVNYPSSISLAAFEDEHMISGQDFADNLQPEYSLDIRQFSARTNRVHENRVIPTLSNTNANTVVYDLAVVTLQVVRNTYVLVPFGPSTTAWAEYYALC